MASNTALSTSDGELLSLLCVCYNLQAQAGLWQALPAREACKRPCSSPQHTHAASHSTACSSLILWLQVTYLRAGFTLLRIYKIQSNKKAPLQPWRPGLPACAPPQHASPLPRPLSAPAHASPMLPVAPWQAVSQPRSTSEQGPNDSGEQGMNEHIDPCFSQSSNKDVASSE